MVFSNVYHVYIFEILFLIVVYYVKISGKICVVLKIVILKSGKLLNP